MNRIIDTEVQRLMKELKHVKCFSSVYTQTATNNRYRKCTGAGRVSNGSWVSGSRGTQSIVASSLGRTEYQLVLMNISVRDQNVKINNAFG